MGKTIRKDFGSDEFKGYSAFKAEKKKQQNKKQRRDNANLLKEILFEVRKNNGG
jgi:hypothetical protein